MIWNFETLLALKFGDEEKVFPFFIYFLFSNNSTLLSKVVFILVFWGVLYFFLFFSPPLIHPFYIHYTADISHHFNPRTALNLDPTNNLPKSLSHHTANTQCDSVST